MEKKEFRVMIKYCFLKGRNTVVSKNWLDGEFLDTAPPTISTIKYWYVKFKRSGMSTEDGEHSGRPKEVVTDENIKKKSTKLLKVAVM